MYSFRSIAPSTAAAQDGTDGEDSGGSRTPSVPLAKKPRAVAHACKVCRQRKAKCDGGRPKCGPCKAKGAGCGYDDDSKPGVESMRVRLAALEEVVKILQDGPMDEAQNLLEKMRLTKELPDTSGVRGPSQPQVDPVPSGSRRSALPFPDVATCQQAVDGFFNCSGKLFHVFSPSQVAAWYGYVFRGDGSSTLGGDDDDDDDYDDKAKAAACCLSALCAVGCHYIAGDVPLAVQEAFYEIARSHFEDIIDVQPLNAIKVCTLLAMYNVMNKATVALAYVEIGLSMARRHHLHDRSYRHNVITPDAWLDYRRTWRTLMFITSWTSSTLGYISGNDALSRAIPLSEMDVDASSDIVDTVQAEMTKIVLLKSQILRAHLASKELTVLATRSVLDDLQRWHEQVPEALRMHKLYGHGSVADTVVRRSIYHVHLLYLGAIILLFRRVAWQYVRSHHLGGGGDDEPEVPPSPFDVMTLDLAQQGLTAAEQSARIFNLLQEEDGIFRRCWLVIFQAYASCVIILHAVAQKQIFNHDPAVWDEDLQLASHSLSALEYCGAGDIVAARFHARLQPFYDELVAWRIDEVDGAVDDEQEAAAPPPDHGYGPAYLLHIPPGSSPRPARLSRALLAILCRPFSGPDATDEDDDVLGSDRGFGPQDVVGGDGDAYHPASPFSWNVRGMGLEPGRLSGVLHADGDMAAGHRFLDSRHPSGWSSDPGMMHMR